MHGSFTGQVAPRVAVARVIGDLREQGLWLPRRSELDPCDGPVRPVSRARTRHPDLEAVDPGIVRAFLTAPSGDGGYRTRPCRHLRRCAVRCFYRTARQLGLATGDPTLDVEVPAWRPQVFRPLTDGEVEICRAIAAAAPPVFPVWSGRCVKRRPAPGNSPASPGRTWTWTTSGPAPGNEVRARSGGELTDWGLQQLPTRPGRAAHRDAPLVPATRRKSPISSSTAVSIVTGILTRAGLDRTMGVRPASIAAWVGRSVSARRAGSTSSPPVAGSGALTRRPGSSAGTGNPVSDQPGGVSGSSGSKRS